jgi:hypothetical protein
MANLSLSAVSVGVFTALNVAGLTALVSTRIYDDIPRNPTYPLVMYSVDETEARGLGTAQLPELDLRVSVFSTSATGAEAQAIVAKVKDLLKDAALTVSGYAMAGRVVWRETVKLGTTEINGVKVNEWAVLFTFWVEAAA